MPVLKKAGNLLSGKKPKAMPGGTRRKERQTFRSLKGAAFLKRKKGPLSIEKMCRKLTAIKKTSASTEEQNNKIMEYFNSAIFSPETKKGIEFLGLNNLYLKKNWDMLEKRIKNCDKKELKKIRKALERIEKEVENTGEYINHETMSLEKFVKGKQLKTGDLRHAFRGYASAMGLTLEIINISLEKRLEAR